MDMENEGGGKKKREREKEGVSRKKHLWKDAQVMCFED